jgi:hypothetical protein
VKTCPAAVRSVSPANITPSTPMFVSAAGAVLHAGAYPDCTMRMLLPDGSRNAASVP